MTTTDMDDAVKSILSPDLFEDGEVQEELPFEEEEPEEGEEDSDEDAPSEEDEDEAEDDEGADTEEDEEEPEVYTVKVDGKETQVTLDELKRGYSGQKYVQQGMEQVAEMRKQVEHFAQVLNNERQNVMQTIQLIEQGIPTPPVEPSRDTFKNDPIGFMEAKLRYEDDVREYQGKMGQLQQARQQYAQHQVQQQESFVKEQFRLLRESDPDFADQKKAAQLGAKLIKYGQEAYGISPEEFKTIADHRAYRVLKDAIAYRELMSNKESATRKKAKRSTKTVGGGRKRSDTTARQKTARQTRERLKRTGSIKDAAQAILLT